MGGGLIGVELDHTLSSRNALDLPLVSIEPTAVVILTARYLSHLVGHEGSGSLLSLLKAKGWANGLSAGPYESATDWANFIVSVECTESGIVS